MTDHNFTDEENILLLLKRSDDLYANAKLKPEEAKTLLDLINRQKAEIERLTAVHADMTESLRLAAEANKDMQAEIERLESLTERLGNDVDVKLKYIYELEEQLKTAKSEAIKEFAERAIDLAVCKDNGDGTERMFVSTANLRKILKEMTEGGE